MRYNHLLAPLCAFLSVQARADDTQRPVLQAREILRPLTWCRAITVENAQPSQYPARFCALVFELNAILWIYIPLDGTQSLSHYRNQPEYDKSHLGDLLRLIEPGITRWGDLTAATSLAPSQSVALPNGCFIESIALLAHLWAASEHVAAPQLLSYYISTPAGLHGHTVLAFRRSKGTFVIDPHSPMAIQSLAGADANNALDLARRLRPDCCKAASVSLDAMYEAMTSRRVGRDQAEGAPSPGERRMAGRNPARHHG